MVTVNQTLRMTQIKLHESDVKVKAFEPDTKKGLEGLGARLKEWIGSVVFRTNNSRSLVKKAVIEHLGGKEEFNRILSHGGTSFKYAMKFGGGVTRNDLNVLIELCQRAGKKDHGIVTQENGAYIAETVTWYKDEDGPDDLDTRIWNGIQNRRLNEIEGERFNPSESTQSNQKE